MSIPELRQLHIERLRSADEQRIAAADQLTVRIYRHDNLNVTTFVPSSGRVNLPLAGDVELVGVTVEGANQAIAEKLSRYVVKPSVSTTILKSASGLPGRITDPHVSVEVMAFGGQKILVLGEVQRPGVYVSEGGSRLLEIVARAGGPTDDEKLGSVALRRPATETAPARRAVVNLGSALKSGDVTQNLPVQSGDVIFIPKTTIANVAQFFEHVPGQGLHHGRGGANHLRRQGLRGLEAGPHEGEGRRGQHPPVPVPGAAHGRLQVPPGKRADDY